MTWDDWSDKEIGFAITTLINDVNGWSLSEDGSLFYHCGIDGSGYFSIDVIDINNPADMWPIIVENKIWIQPDMVGDGYWHCYDCEEIATVKDKNPLRAAAIVFLMMKGVKPDERI